MVVATLRIAVVDMTAWILSRPLSTTIRSSGVRYRGLACAHKKRKSTRVAYRGECYGGNVFDYRDSNEHLGSD